MCKTVAPNNGNDEGHRYQRCNMDEHRRERPVLHAAIAVRYLTMLEIKRMQSAAACVDGSSRSRFMACLSGSAETP